jgi:outer membrane protein OmpA-like peptidoglycan-associated protein
VRALRATVLVGLAACAASPPPNPGAPAPASASAAGAAASGPLAPPGNDPDGDGIPAGADKCPHDPENYNGSDDGDGCPDTAGSAANEISGRVYFDVGRAEIKPPAFLLLDVIAAAIKAEPDRYPVIALEGYAASNERGAMRLSLSRASAVRIALMDRGIDATRLMARASGATMPLCREPSERCWERERRVEFAILPGAGAVDAGAPAGEAAIAERERPEPPAAKPATGAAPPLERVAFAKGSALLTPANLPMLDLLAGFLKSNSASMEIDGHAADNERNADKLAEARAAAVRAYLLACGVNAQSLVVRSHGDKAPACKEKSSACREQNRRVELRLP